MEKNDIQGSKLCRIGQSNNDRKVWLLQRHLPVIRVTTETCATPDLPLSLYNTF